MFAKKLVGYVVCMSMCLLCAVCAAEPEQDDGIVTGEQDFSSELSETLLNNSAPFVFELNSDVLTSRDEKDDYYQQMPLYRTVMAVIKLKYVKDVTIQELVNASLHGMVSALDPYSEFLTKEEFEDLENGTDGNYGGTGLIVGIRDNALVVITTLEGTPARKAGLQTGDMILKIDDEETSVMSARAAVSLLRGKPKTLVKLLVKRKDERDFIEYAIERDFIHVDSVQPVQMLADDIAYIRVVDFDKKVHKLLKQELKKIDTETTKGLVLDLRNNPGGLLTSGVDVSHLFLTEGTFIVSAKDRNGKETLHYCANGKQACPDVPIVVLINKGSASAAEIVAAALRDNDRALVIGERSFGKGSVQMVVPFPDRTALRLTTAMYYTPRNVCIEGEGIEPDMVITPHVWTDGELSEESLLNDVQVSTAVSVLKGFDMWKSKK